MRTIILAVAGFAFGAAACSSSGTSIEVVRKPVAAVSVVLPSPSIAAGLTEQAVATPMDDNGAPLADRSITWQSSNPAIASVNNAGLISAATLGTTIISATSEGVRGEGSLSVIAPPPVPVASVTVSPATATVQIGQTQQLTATLRDASNNVLTGRSVAWTSSNTAVATTSASGLVSAHAAGSATITATSGSASGTASITVPGTPPPPVGQGPVVFSDDFESGSLSKWNETNTQAVITNASLAHSGNSFMRMTYSGGSGGWMNKYFTQGFTRLYVRLWVRFSTNFAGGTKLVSLRGAPIGQPELGVGRAGICPNGRDSFSANFVTEFTGADAYPSKMYTYWQDMWPDPDGKCWGHEGPRPVWTAPYITPMPVMTKGTWHLVEFAVKMNSSATAADGEQKFWIDGVKYGDWKEIRWGDPAYVNLGVLQINGSATSTQSQTMDIDDLELVYDYPTQ